MKLTAQSYAELKEKVAAAQQDATRAQGERDALLRQLKTEYECNNQREGEALLQRFERKEEQARKAFEEAVEAYRQKWEG